ncbi:class I SAM-dependent methyltransferase [Caulobacter sp. HMWF025]|uniref:class I SAM-dependent methyltransferase n=2 Tax=unclassified Caulobacter TaxID=2648921 RepID=UPI000D3D2492|nr:class I SAM-dependent methyltransferase [Caulobacter sp. HMWF025]PTT09989.1 methyltransferase [Caulobacter sp. HMWF025]
MQTPRTALYGHADHDLAPVASDALQLSPLIPGASDVAALADGSIDAIAIRAPAGVVERRFVLAHALRALAPEGRLTVFAPKDRGGQRLRKELEAFGCVVGESSKRHNRICVALRPDAVRGTAEAIAAGAPQQGGNGLWTQPGVFSWDRLDPGTALLLKTMPPLSGMVADFGCGIGWLSRAVLQSPTVTKLALIDLDRRAIDAARRNIEDSRASFVWDDLRKATDDLGVVDFVVTNPPFHETGGEDRSLGQAFIRLAATSLKKGGRLWLVANRHLPYEAILAEHFASVRLAGETNGYKVFEARK